MNRRDFIKKASAMGALTTWTVTCKYEEEEHDPKGEKGEVGETGYNWDYRVYCYEREQGEWTFSENIKGSFAPEREYMTFDQEQDLMVTHSTLQEASADQNLMLPYTGFMDGGKLHFRSLEEAQDFIDMHAKAKDDTNLIDSIYDIYYVSRELDEKEIGSGEYKETEIQVAHYWLNGDTGRQINWVAEKPYTDWNKVEFA
jgi:hypothetical protein